MELLGFAWWLVAGIVVATWRVIWKGVAIVAAAVAFNKIETEYEGNQTGGESEPVAVPDVSLPDQL